jgi:hypothetical protein
MSSWGRKRQAIIIAYILLAVLIAAAFLYFFVLYTPPSCFDGEQNGSEEGVDCGGSCSKVCAFQAARPNIVWSRSFQVGEGVYNVAAFIDNPNFEVGTDLAYTIRGYDDKNVIVAEIQDSVQLAPREQRVVFHQAVNTENRDIERTFITFDDNHDWYKGEPTPELVGMLGYRLDKVDTNPSLEVDIRNTSVQPLSDVEIIVVLYNQDENVEHVSRTVVDRLEPASDRTVFFSWREPFDNFITRVEIFTHPRE